MNKSVWPIEGTLTCTTTSGQSGPGSNATPSSWMLHDWRITIKGFADIPRTLVIGDGLIPQQNWSLRILQPKPNGLESLQDENQRVVQLLFCRVQLLIYLKFSRVVLLKFKLCNHTIVRTRQLLGKINVLFFQRIVISVSSLTSQYQFVIYWWYIWWYHC